MAVASASRSQVEAVRARFSSLDRGFAFVDAPGGTQVPGGPDAVAHERALCARFLAPPESAEVYGPALAQRVPAFPLNARGVPARTVSETLAERGLGVWHHTHYYAVGLAGRLPYEHEAVRPGCIHYDTLGEADRLVAELAALEPGRGAGG